MRDRVTTKQATRKPRDMETIIQERDRATKLEIKERECDNEAKGQLNIK